MNFSKLSVVILLLLSFSFANADTDKVQAGGILTVAEGKRLIGKSIARLPEVKKALEQGIVIICRGTTNTYVAEEILGQKFEHGPFTTGKIYPSTDAKKVSRGNPISEIVLINGKWEKEVSFKEALEQLKPGDVVIKGGNALDYKNKLAGVCIGAPDGGTTGKFMPYVVARKAHLIIPIGLEKQVTTDLITLSEKMQEPIEYLSYVPSMFLLNGKIVTEIEAIKTFADVEAFDGASGGIGGAEGSTWIVVRGKKEEVEKALKTIESVQGEKPFADTDTESKN
ncbi:MAG: hypothetical protein ACIAQZ_12155 [Sedimentisphaeraceae bacterium JB056]